jgi:hypothetical protein
MSVSPKFSDLAEPGGSANITNTDTHGTSAPPISGNIFTDFANNTSTLVFSALFVMAFILFILLLVFVVVTRSKLEASRRIREDSEGDIIYENTTTKPSVRKGESMKTRMLPQLPPITVEKKPSLDTADTEENAYLVPSLPVWYSCDKEIKNLPPAPPLYPKCLANLQLEGEGSYMLVLSDEEAKISAPSSPCEISCDDNTPEMCEESGYVQPRQIREIPVETSSSETECPRKVQKVKENERQKSKRANPDTAVQREPKDVQDMSACKPDTDEDVSEIKSESSNDEKVKKFRSTLQIHLSPPTRPRHIPVSARETTVVMYIHTKQN